MALHSDNRTVLLVDDDPEFLLTWRLTMEMYGGFGLGPRGPRRHLRR